MKTYFIFSFLFSIVITQSCNTGDRQIQQRCFNLVNQQLSWSEARNYCHNRNSYLATVPEQTTDSYLASYARTSFNINEGNFWIGLYRNSTTSKWQWDDGTPFAWNNFENPNLNYVAESIKNGKWNTFVAETRLNFVCSYYPNGAPTEPVTGSTEPPHWTTTESETVTPTDSGSCLPTDPSTFFFAYSNDLERQNVYCPYYSICMDKKYASFASVRFDLQNPEPINYASSNGEMWEFMKNHLPDPSLAYTDPNETSDVITMITQFLNNTQVPICGSQIVILMKRHLRGAFPNIDFINRMIESNNIHIIVLSSMSPVGGYETSLYGLTSFSKGICAYADDGKFEKIFEHIFPSCQSTAYPYLVYSKDVEVLAIGNMTLPNMNLPYTNEYQLLMTVQDHGTRDEFKKLRLEWTNMDSSATGFVETNSTDPTEMGGTLFWSDGNIKMTSGSYDMKLSYSYSYTNPQILQIRFYSVKPINYFV